MKKLFTLLSLLVVAVSMFGQEFTIGDLTYAVLSEEEKTAQVVNGQNATGAVVVPSSVTYEDVVYNVTGIGENAFYENTEITSISSSSVISVGFYAFGYARGLSTISLPKVISIDGKAFYGCSSLSSLSLPLSETIGSEAFIGCGSLTSLFLPSVISVGSYAICQCDQLKELVMPKVETIDEWAIQYNPSLRYVDLSSVKSIGTGAFYNSSNISRLRIGSVDQWCQANFGESYANPFTQTSQSVELYVGDSELPAKNLVASSELTQIPNWAFSHVSIESFSAPAATSIGDAAFANCTSLTSVDLPTVTNIGGSAFSFCFALTTINLPVATTIKSYAFEGCESLEETIMPKVETIDEYAFSRSALTSVNLPAATNIASYAFHGCESLEEAIIPKVETIGEYTFAGTYSDEDHQYHSALKRIDLSSVKTIGNEAFRGCSNISSLRIGSVDQWCQVNYGEYGANPLQYTSQAVTLYVGNSEAPAKDIVASNSLTEIPNGAFYGISNIESFSAPAATSIGDAAFINCTSLISIDLPVATYIGNSAFEGTALTSVNLPAATTIKSEAFHGCKSLEEAIMPKVDTVNEHAFAGCTSLVTMELPNAISIGDYSYAGCESLEEAIIPKAENIGYHAFGIFAELIDDEWQHHYCTSLKHLDLSSAKTIGDNAFCECRNISSVRIGSLEQWCGIEFEGESSPLQFTQKNVSLYIGDSSAPVSDIVLPNTVTKIPNYAFRGVPVTSVSAPSVTYVGDEAFEAVNADNKYDSMLEHVNLPAATYIGKMCFSDCNKITSLELPEVKEIGYQAFAGMAKLSYLAIPKLEILGGNTFVNANNLSSLRVGSVEQYCKITRDCEPNNWMYDNTFPFRDDYNNFIFIGDSETPVTEITITSNLKIIPEHAFRGTNIHTVHFEGAVPPKLISTNSFPAWTMLAVPEEAYETYLAADVYNTIPLQITKDGHITQELEVEAKSTTSALLAKIGDQEIRNVVNLKLKGTINSYDMLIIRNRMTSLRNLDLSEASIVDCDYAYSTSNGNSYHSVKDEITGDWLMGLMNVKLPADTKTIGDNAFNGCGRLVSVEIPDGVTSIGSNAFQSCNRIKDLTLPQSVVSFGYEAFNGCTGLKEVIIPDGVTSINSQAFYGCVNLKKVTIPASVTEIGTRAFAGLGNEYYVEVDGQGMWVRDPISLRISSIDTWKDVEMSGYYWEGGPFDNVGTLYIGESDEPVEEIIIPEGTEALKDFTFFGFKCIKNVTLPEELTRIGNHTFRNSGISQITFPDSLNSIGSYAFSGTLLSEVKLPEKIKEIGEYTFANCRNLESIEFNDSLVAIYGNAFENCSNLKKIELPAYLQTIGSYAFNNCGSLTEVLIPASIQEIGDYAFIGCGNLNKVIATTVEPININQNTFSTYRTASVYSPRTSYWKYYWNTQWNQFLSVREYGRHRYKYFYLRGHHGGKKEDFEIDDETGTLEGTENEVTGEEKAPDADFGEEAGIIVGGSQIQELGDIHIHHNGNNGASVIAKNQGKVHIDNLYVDIKTQPNRWYFFCFPFDIKPGEATFGGSHVWYLYDGEARALNGNGGWKKVASDGVMKSGNGYIFQGAVNGTLSIHVKDITIDTSDNSTNMITYQSENKNDASWNLIGNANYAYYGISDLMLDVPVTVYDNETGNYEAVRAGDDDYEFYPFQAFFVQKPEGTESVDFENSKKNTKNKSDEKKARRVAERAKAPRHVDAMRKIINLELVEENMQNDSVAAPTDRTRIVVNPTKSMAYEMDCDAAKFIAENMHQIYSLGNDGSMYAINERPIENGIVNIAVKTVKSGMYTISAPRLDCDAQLRDLETGSAVDLSKGGYTFAADVATYTNRFQLILANEATAITATEDAMAAISVEAGAIRINKANADVKIYTVGGSLVASQKGTGSISVPSGIYVVVVNGKSTKVTVKE